MGKEICDLLAIFGNHVIIFSDKDCEYPHGIDKSLAWSRWYRKAVSSSAKQIFGAERWLREHPDRVFTDTSCSVPLPIHIPRADDAIFHRIIVAHGASRACEEHFPGSRGSLVLDNQIVGEAAHVAQPFHIGLINPDKGFVHVFDDITLDIILRTLDTIADFTSYLEKKANLLGGNRTVIAPGEEELLASYVGDLNEKGEHDFLIPDDVNWVAYPEGQWNHFLSSKERAAQIRANRVSYSWDSLIEKFTTHTYLGTHRTTTQKTIQEQELIYRWLARENRTRRRMLSRAFIGIILKTPNKMRAVRLIEPSGVGDPYYVFLVVPKVRGESEDRYREVRQWLLGQYCIAIKLRYPDAEDVVGLATESGNDEENRSEDLIYVDLRIWTPEMEADAKEVQNKLGLLTRVNRIAGREQEYPTTQQPLMGPLGVPVVSRNKACPCKSGKRYRKCCGKGKFR